MESVIKNIFKVTIVIKEIECIFKVTIVIKEIECILTELYMKTGIYYAVVVSTRTSEYIFFK